jgi:hypothetical protein
VRVRGESARCECAVQERGASARCECAVRVRSASALCECVVQKFGEDFFYCLTVVVGTAKLFVFLSLVLFLTPLLPSSAPGIPLKEKCLTGLTFD